MCAPRFFDLAEGEALAIFTLVARYTIELHCSSKGSGKRKQVRDACNLILDPRLYGSAGSH